MARIIPTDITRSLARGKLTAAIPAR